MSILESMNIGTGLALLRNEFPRVTGLPIDQWDATPTRPGRRCNARIRTGSEWFAVVFRAAANTEQINSAIKLWSEGDGLAGRLLLVVPYMGPAGQEICQHARIDWIDLSGNAQISSPNCRIRVIGSGNRFKRPGRPETLFSSSGARIARHFLSNQNQECTQTELANETGVSAGYLSRLLPRFEDAGFIASTPQGRAIRYRLTNPDALLDAWDLEHPFQRQTIVRGHVPARSGPELLRSLTLASDNNGLEYAATGLAAAWAMHEFASFRTAALYISDLPSDRWLADTGFQTGPRGANTWLILPGDRQILAKTCVWGDIRCVDPIQTYLDLKHQSERSAEAREELRRTFLDWSTPPEPV